MNARVAVLKQLVADGSYPIDEVAIAEAMLARSILRRAVPDVAFRCAAPHESKVRSFRPHRGARSFRLARAERRSLERRLTVAA